jgi:hypothetical protein
VRGGLAAKSMIGAALLATAGCDFWNNIIEDKKPARADLEIDVVDAWTGEAMQDATCYDSLQLLAIDYLGNGAYGRKDAPTGPYTITCGHKWYHDATAEVRLTESGARIVIKLARQVGATNWYPGMDVRIPDIEDTLRYPRDLDWLASPADDSGHFLYEWSFSMNTRLNHGPWQTEERQAPKEAYSPRFHAKVSAQNGILRGPETVTLKVYSLLHDPKHPELVGTDSKTIAWVANVKPTVRFSRTVFFTDSSHAVHPRWKVDCKGLRDPHNTLFDASDSDGQCRSVRLRAWNSASLPDFDTLLSCELNHFTVHLPLVDPRKVHGDTVPRVPESIDADGAEVYDNTLIAEMVDDNGERGSDTVHFRTVRNCPPTARLYVTDTKTVFSVGDSMQVKVVATDPDGWFNTIGVPWVIENSPNQYQDIRYKYNNPEANTDSFTVFIALKIPGAAQFWARVADDCEEIFETRPQSVQVGESRSP